MLTNRPAEQLLLRRKFLQRLCYVVLLFKLSVTFTSLDSKQGILLKSEKQPCQNTQTV